MGRKKISRRQGFSFNDIPRRSLRPGAKASPGDSAGRLKDRDLIFEAFWQSLIDRDIDSFKEILRNHLEAVNKRAFARRSKTSRRTLHRILAPGGNPTLKSISNIIHALYG